MVGIIYTVEYAENAIQTANVFAGRIFKYDRKKGYGTIYKRSHGKDMEVHFRKEDFAPGSDAMQARVGSRVTFRLDIFNERVYARDIKIAGHIYDGHTRKLELPDGKTVNYKDVLKYGKGNLYIRATKICEGLYTKEDIGRMGYRVADFEYVYIRTTRGEYKIFGGSSPVTGNGRVADLDEYLRYLNKELMLIKNGVIQCDREL